MRRLATLALLVAACSPAEPPSPAFGRQKIVGGAVDNGDPAVVLVLAEDLIVGGAALCTGEVVSPHVVLTAAHCVDPDIVGPNRTYRIFLGNDLTDPAQATLDSNWIPAQTYAFDHAIDIDNMWNGHDVGVVILKDPAPCLPLPMNRTALGNSTIGETTRLVGYGVTSAGNGDSGTKRQVSTPVTNVTTLFVEAGTASRDTCRGDSGGPALLTVDGREVIAGVLSFGNVDCSSADWTRVDVVAAPFADSYINQYDADAAPLCPASGSADVCAGDNRLVHCDAGAVSSWVGCYESGSYCSTAGATPTTARCVSKSCVSSAADAPRAFDSCTAKMGVVRHCDADGQATTQDCLREEQCDEVGGAHCAVAVCPGIRNADVCIDARTVGQCQGGSVVGHKDCGADVCAVSGGQAHCAPASACGCSTGGSAASSVWTLGLALAVLAARRRRIG